MSLRRLSLALMAVGALTVSALGPAEAGHAASLCVNASPTSSCFHTIGAAIAGAANGDTITVAPGTYTESLDLHRNISLVGSGLQTTTLTAASSTGSALTVESGSSVTVTGLTISKGFMGALVNSGGSLTLTASRVTGAMFNIDNLGTLTLNGTSVDHAIPVIRIPSAGILNSGTATLTSSTVSRNVDIGIEHVAGTLTLHRSAVINNTLIGIYILGGTVTVDSASTVHGNPIRNCFVVGGILNGICR